MCLMPRSESRTVSQSCRKENSNSFELVEEKTINQGLQSRRSFLVSSEDP